MEELKPCRYCGNKARLHKLDINMFYVSCDVYACNRPTFTVCPTEDIAVEEWNKDNEKRTA